MAELRKYTVQEAADLLGYTPRRIQQMCQQGIIKGAVKEGRKWIIYSENIFNIIPVEDGDDDSVFSYKPRNSRLTADDIVNYRYVKSTTNDIVDRQYVISHCITSRTPLARTRKGTMFLKDSVPFRNKVLPIGLSEYNLVMADFYYVDKTLFIKDFIDNAAHVSLFTRPRRFGKSLNLDMLKSFFEMHDENNAAYFFDKKIWDCGSKYREMAGEYPVIYLSFKDIKSSTWDDTYYSITSLIAKEYLRHDELRKSTKLDEYEKSFYFSILGHTANAVDYSLSLQRLSEMLKKHYHQRPIVLIDEYDAPLQSAYLNGYYKEALEFIRMLFSAVLKDNSSNITKAALTGITQYTEESIFSGLNNIVTYSVLDEQFSEYFGFTEEEVRDMLKFFGHENKYDEVCEWYDGYVFGGRKIFNPWSIINYVSNGFKARPFWVNVSSNDLFGKLIYSSSMAVKELLVSLLQGMSATASVDTSVSYPSLEGNTESLLSYLTVTGYLKAENGFIDDLGDYIGDVSIPNKEIASIFKKEIISKLQPENCKSIATELSHAMKRHDFKELQTIIKKYLIESVSYFDTANESFYHGLMLGLCAILSSTHRIRSNRESGYGRFDIELSPMQDCQAGIILELKAAKDDDDLKASSREALSQIKTKEYYSEMRSNGVLNIIALAVAFRGKDAEISTEIL